MIGTLHTCLRFTAFLIMAGACISTAAQGPSSADEKLPMKAALLLTPAFCTSKIAHGVQENPKVGIEVGKDACADFETALKQVFATLTTVDDAQKAEDAQVMLTPKFVDAGTLMEGSTAFSNYELDIFLQWTATDTSGRTIWLETVQGSSTHHIGNMFTARKNLRLNISDAVKELAAKSASKMLASVELRKFSQ